MSAAASSSAGDFGAWPFDFSCASGALGQLRRAVLAMSGGHGGHGRSRGGPWEREFGGRRGPGHWGGGFGGARGGWWPGPPAPPGPPRGPRGQKASRGDVRAAILALAAKSRSGISGTVPAR